MLRKIITALISFCLIVCGFLNNDKKSENPIFHDGVLKEGTQLSVLYDSLSDSVGGAKPISNSHYSHQYFSNLTENFPANYSKLIGFSVVSALPLLQN